jgi:hypothetical protein
LNGTPLTCPRCKADLRDKEIPRDSLEEGWYGPWKPEDGPQYYSKVIGVEQPGVYDGTLYWCCPFCKGKWHRFDEPHMRRLAEPYVMRP